MTEGERTLALFLGSYAATGVVLGVAMLLGHKGAIRGHIAAIAVFLAGFGVTIYFADRTGHFYKFDRVRESIHLPLAYAATAITVLPLVTGFRRWRGSGSLRAHRLAIAVFLAAFVAASATGGLMLATRAGK